MKNIRSYRAFTLVELLTALAILALLLGVFAPAVREARRSALAVVSSLNQRNTVTAVSCYAADQDYRFPESVATLGTGLRWSWREPTVVTGFEKRSPLHHRSAAEYLNRYIENASTLFCPSAPTRYEFAQQAWDAGDTWDHPGPDTAAEDPLFGNFCFYWSYVGYLVEPQKPFIGPRSTTGKRGESTLLISDYFGYDHWRNELTYGTRSAYGSCSPMESAGVTEGTSVACDFWSLLNADGNISRQSIRLRLRAGYVDGHVEVFAPADTMSLKVSMTPDGRTPYPDGIGPAGTFFIPRNSW